MAEDRFLDLIGAFTDRFIAAANEICCDAQPPACDSRLFWEAYHAGTIAARRMLEEFCGLEFEAVLLSAFSREIFSLYLKPTDVQPA